MLRRETHFAPPPDIPACRAPRSNSFREWPHSHALTERLFVRSSLTKPSDDCATHRLLNDRITLRSLFCRPQEEGLGPNIQHAGEARQDILTDDTVDVGSRR